MSDVSDIDDDTDVAELMQLHAMKDRRLRTLIGDRFRPGALHEKDERPAVWYETTQSDPNHDLEGASGSAQSRVRFGCCGNSQREAKAVAKIIRDLFDGFTGYIDDAETVEISDCILDNKWDTREKPTAGSAKWAFTRNVDFIVTHSEPVPSLTVVPEDEPFEEE
ncbi:hypothetical protein [Lacipirellula sp.]|uniref:hypothetical protein n=1 Tax=Lacipirellula sp. TaxID=2691419 RepID=UPI003D0EEE51